MEPFASAQGLTPQLSHRGDACAEAIGLLPLTLQFWHPTSCLLSYYRGNPTRFSKGGVPTFFCGHLNSPGFICAGCRLKA